MSTFSYLAAEVEPRTIAPGPRLNEQSVMCRTFPQFE